MHVAEFRRGNFCVFNSRIESSKRRVEISSEKRTVHRVEVMSRRWNWIVECLQFVEVCICNKLFVVGNVDKKEYLCLRIKSKKIEKYVIYIFINSRINNVEEIEIFLIR